MQKGWMLVGALALLGGCSFEMKCGGPTIAFVNMDEVRPLIAGYFEKQAGVKPDYIRCPDSAPLQKGHKFNCEVLVGELTQGFEVEQTSDDGKVFARPVPPMLALAKQAEAQLQGAMEKNEPGRKVTFWCGEKRVMASTPGTHMDCSVIDEKGVVVAAVRLHITDEAGAFKSEDLPLEAAPAAADASP